MSILSLAFLTLAAFLPNLAALWTSDDYVLVHGIYGNPELSFVQALSRTTDGNLTAHRALTYWFIGKGGLVGPAAAHLLALVLHFTNTCIFGALVWRLFRSPTLAFLSAAWFCVAPWISQPVIWWSSVCTIASTICMLVAAHFLINSFGPTEPARRLSWIFLACMSAFIGLLLYDLWLAGFLLFVGGPDWGGLWRMGVEALADPVETITFFLGVGLFTVIVVQMTEGESEKPFKRSQKSRSSACFPWNTLLFCWLMFLGSRLAIVLHGGTPLASRLNYGAAMAVALGGAALAQWTWRRWIYSHKLIRWLAILMAGISIVFMTLANIGRSRHMAQSSAAERYTIDLLDRRLKENPNVRSVAVLGTPVPDIGELNYFSEADGLWLQHVLKGLGNNQRIRVVRSDNHAAICSSDLALMWSGAWPGARLEEVGCGGETR